MFSWLYSSTCFPDFTICWTNFKECMASKNYGCVTVPQPWFRVFVSNASCGDH